MAPGGSQRQVTMRIVCRRRCGLLVHSLPRDLAFGFSGSAEPLAKSRVPATYCSVLVSRVMAGDTSFARGGVSPHLEALVREAHREAWIVVARDERLATTRTGSTPGHTLVDLALNCVMLDALQEVAGKLRGVSLIDRVEWYSEAGPFGVPCGQPERLEVLPIAFMDDIHAFSSHGSSEQAARALAKTAELFSQVLESYGLLVNWKPGKPESLLALRGKGAAVAATHLKRVRATRGHPGAWFVYLNGISNIVLDAPRGYQTGPCWHSRVHASCAHEGIEMPTRQALARSLILSVLLSGAGTWPQLTVASARRIRAVFMRVQRMLLGNSRGTAVAACDSEVLRELGASSLAVELRKARLMYVPHLVCVEQSLLAAVLQSVIARGSLG